MWKIEHLHFADTSLTLATTVWGNHGLAACFEDTFAKLVEGRLTGEQIFELYRSTLKDKDALAGVVKGLVWEKEVVDTYLSEAAQRVFELEVKIRKLKGMKSSLEAQISESSS